MYSKSETNTLVDDFRVKLWKRFHSLAFNVLASVHIVCLHARLSIILSVVGR